MLRVHRIPHSTNCDRVSLAAGLKGLELEVAAGPLDADDQELFHRVLLERSGLAEAAPEVHAWIARMAQLPRA